MGKAITTAKIILSGVVDAFRPAERMEVWEWAEKNVTLTKRVTRFEGRWRRSVAPYMSGKWSPLWAFLRYRVIDVIAGAQTGKTMLLQLTIGFSVAGGQPGPGMIVYPDQTTCRRR